MRKGGRSHDLKSVRNNMEIQYLCLVQVVGYSWATFQCMLNKPTAAHRGTLSKEKVCAV